MDKVRPMTIEAGGRPFTLGRLYNCYNDTLILSDEVRSDVTSPNSPNPNESASCEFKHEIEDSFSKKAALLNICSSLKLSYLSGLIEAVGSTKYFDNSVSSGRQERVSVCAKISTHFKPLGKASPNTDFPKILKSTTATHYVAGITYGANIVLVFDKWHSQERQSTEPSGDIAAIINAFSGVQIGVGASAQIKQDLENVLSQFKFKFYGDISLRNQQIPIKPEQAFEVFQSLSENNSVPMKIYLEPIPNSNKKFCEVSADTTAEVESVLEGLHTLGVVGNDLLSSPGCKNFSRLDADIKKFLTVVEKQKKAIQSLVKNMLPQIRSGKINEENLKRFLINTKSSLVSCEKLKQYLDAKKGQVSALTTLSKGMLKFATVITGADKFHEVAFKNEDTYIVSYTVSISSSSMYLDRCLGHINGEETSSDTWPQMIGKEQGMVSDNSLGEQANVFKTFYDSKPKDSKLVFIVMESKNHGQSIAPTYRITARIQMYKGNNLLHEDFVPLGKPDLLNCWASSSDICVAQPSSRRSEIVKYYEVECQSTSGCPDLSTVRIEGNKSNYYIKIRHPSTKYKVRCRGFTEISHGLWSDDVYVTSESFSIERAFPQGYCWLL